MMKNLTIYTVLTTLILLMNHTVYAEENSIEQNGMLGIDNLYSTDMMAKKKSQQQSSSSKESKSKRTRSSSHGRNPRSSRSDWRRSTPTNPPAKRGKRY